MGEQLFRIKSLEWQMVANDWWLAQAVGVLRYSVGWRGNSWRWWHSNLPKTFTCASPEEGKQLAEAHWREYIAQALIPVETCKKCGHYSETDPRGRCISVYYDAGGSLVYCGCVCTEN